MTTAALRKAQFLEVVGDDHSGAGSAYAPLGSPTTQPLEMIIITSTFDNPVFLSVNGTTDHIFVPSTTTLPNSSISVNFSANKQNIGRLELPSKTQFYMKQGPDGAPTEGDLYITLIYAG